MVLNSLGGIYSRQGQFENAIQAFEQSFKIEDQLGNTRGQAMVLTSLGCVYQRQGKFSKAISILCKSVQLANNMDDNRPLAMALNSLGTTYYWKNEFDNSIKALLQSYETLEKLKDNQGLAMVSMALGRTFFAQQKLRESITYLKTSFSINKKQQSKKGLQIVTPILCHALQSMGDLADAEHVCQLALKVIPKYKKLIKLKQRLCKKLTEAERRKKKGVIKRIIDRSTGEFFGFITADDGSDDIYFGQNQVDRMLLPNLTEGLAVLVDVEVSKRGPRAKCQVGMDG
jgi:tetratricopeptide (TPR) repeat protein